MEYTPRFEFQHKTLYWNYSIKWESKPNPFDQNRYWEHEDVYFLSVRKDPNRKWFSKENLMYDLHTFKSITLFGIQFGKGYFWQSKRIL